VDVRGCFEEYWWRLPRRRNAIYLQVGFGRFALPCVCIWTDSDFVLAHRTGQCGTKDCGCLSKDSDRVGVFPFRRELPGREFRYERVSSEGVFVDRLIANRAQDWQKDAAAHEHGGDGIEPGIHGGVAGAKEGSGGAVRVGKAFKSARRRMKEIGEWMYGDDPIR